jgi:hypothetical protein
MKKPPGFIVPVALCSTWFLGSESRHHLDFFDGTSGVDEVAFFLLLEYHGFLDFPADYARLIEHSFQANSEVVDCPIQVIQRILFSRDCCLPR